jgi:hypothetical protein
MARKNRELQRLPPEADQRQALRNRLERGQFRTVVSDDPVYGMLRVQLEHLQEADKLSPRRRGPKPKRQILLKILEILERDHLPIRTSPVSPVVAEIAKEIKLSVMQTRDFLHQLADLSEKLSH